MSLTAVLPPQNLVQKTQRSIFPVLANGQFDPLVNRQAVASFIENNGLLAGSEVSRALLSMSGYGKAPYTHSKNYETTQPLNQAMYLAYSQSGINQPHMPHSPLYSRPSDQATYGAGSLFQQRQSHNQSPATYLPERSRQIPEVTQWSPQTGSQGARVFFNLASAFELDLSLRLEVEFGTRRCPTALTRLQPQGNYHYYVLSAEVPAFNMTGSAGAKVQITLSAQDQSGNQLASVKLEEPFVYTDAVTQTSRDFSRKRRLSDDASDPTETPLKRAATLPSRPESARDYDHTYNYMQQNTPGYLQQSSSLALDTSMNNLLPAYQRAQSQSADSQQGSPRRLPQHITSAPVNSTQAKGQSPQTPSWTTSNLSGGQLPKSPSIPSSINRVASLASPMMANPPLIRTSTLQQSPSPASTPSAVGGFNPYAMYPHKALLKINGDMESMMEDWTEEEREVKRRLVQFTRTQSGSTIATNFEPVAPEERQPNSICISCIWWESRNAYYVTSVDTIYLLESLVAVRFTVEEKNRIRRNLEGFRPLTVSKGKSDSEDFFKLIMGFPNPKPRNIEKDVKVFPWKILSLALKKIISKYSASYSSTAAVLPPSMGSSYPPPPPQDLGGDVLPASPHSTPETHASLTYHSPMTSSSLSGEVQQTPSSYTSTSSAMMPTTIASNYPMYSYSPAQLNHSANTMSLQAQQPSHPGARPPSWDFGNFIEPTSTVNTHGLYSMVSTHETEGYQMTHTSSGA